MGAAFGRPVAAEADAEADDGIWGTPAAEAETLSRETGDWLGLMLLAFEEDASGWPLASKDLVLELESGSAGSMMTPLCLVR